MTARDSPARQIATYLAAGTTLCSDGPSAWVAIYTLAQNGHIQDPQIVREIANRFEALANDVEAAAKVTFDARRAAQALYKQAGLLESLNDDEGAAKSTDEDSGNSSTRSSL